MTKLLILTLNLFLIPSTAFMQLDTDVVSTRNMQNNKEIWTLVSNDIVNFQADVLYIYGDLIVSKYMPDSANHTFPTFRNAYLYPLFTHFKKNNGRFYSNKSNEIYLYINLRYEGRRTFQKLWHQLIPYKEMLAYRVGKKWYPGKMKIILTGETPKILVEKMQTSFVSFEGELNEIDLSKDNELVPVIGVNYRSIIKWNGMGKIPFKEFLKFKEMSDQVHAKGKKLRVYNTPQTEAVWDVLSRNNVDLISSSRPIKLKQFLSNKSKD